MARLKARKRGKRSHTGTLKSWIECTEAQSSSSNNNGTGALAVPPRKGTGGGNAMMRALQSNRVRSQRHASQQTAASSQAQVGSGSSPVRNPEQRLLSTENSPSPKRRKTYVSPSKLLNQSPSRAYTKVPASRRSGSVSTIQAPTVFRAPSVSHSQRPRSHRPSSAPAAPSTSPQASVAPSSKRPRESSAVALNGDSDSGSLSESSVSSFGSFGRSCSRSPSRPTSRADPTSDSNTLPHSSRASEMSQQQANSSSNRLSGDSKPAESSAPARSRTKSQAPSSSTHSTSFPVPRTPESLIDTRPRPVSQPTALASSRSSSPSSIVVESPPRTRARPQSYSSPSKSHSSNITQPTPPPARSCSRSVSRRPTSPVISPSSVKDGATSSSGILQPTSPPSSAEKNAISMSSVLRPTSPPAPSTPASAKGKGVSGDARASPVSPDSPDSPVTVWDTMKLSAEQKAAVAKATKSLREKYAANAKLQRESRIEEVHSAARLHCCDTVTAEEAEVMFDCCGGDEREAIKKLGDPASSLGFLVSTREMVAQKGALPPSASASADLPPLGRSLELGAFSDSDGDDDDDVDSPPRRHPRHANATRRKMLAKKKKTASKKRKRRRRQGDEATMSDYDEDDDEEYSAADGGEEESEEDDDDEEFDPDAARADLASLTRSQVSGDTESSDSDSDEYSESPKRKRRRRAPAKKDTTEQKAREGEVTYRPGYNKDGSKRNKRLLLDDALGRGDCSGWSEARKKAHKSLMTNPNTYFYRFNLGGQKQGRAGWTSAESTKFMERLNEIGPYVGWGLFAFTIPGRVGYQCSAHYRELVTSGKVRDPRFWMNDEGKLHFNKEGKTGYFSNAKNGKNQLGKCKVIALPVRDDAFVVTDHTFPTRQQASQDTIKSLKEMGVNSPNTAPTKPMPATPVASSGSAVSSGSAASSSSSATSSSSSSSSNSANAKPVKKRKRPAKQAKRSRRPRAPIREDDPSFHASLKMTASEKQFEEERKATAAVKVPNFTDQITGEKMVRPAISIYGHVLGYETWMNILNQEPKNVCPFTKQKLVRRQLTKLTAENWLEHKQQVRTKL